MEAVNILREAQLKCGEKQVWANEDLALETRVPEGFLFGCKELLVGFGYKRQIIHVDTDKQELKINGQIVISATVNCSILKIDYHGDFTEWDEFKANSEVNVLRSKASDSLTKTGGVEKGTEKGAGKGVAPAPQ